MSSPSDPQTLKTTPLLDLHQQQGARMAPFGGWNMPIQYPGGILAEHHHTRQHASVFDTCHMGEIRVRGPQAAASLDRLLAREVLNQPVGSCRYNFLTTPQGTIQDDLLVYRQSQTEFLLVVNAGTKDADMHALQAGLPDDCRLTDESATTGKIDLQGPLAREILLEFGLASSDLPAYFRWSACRLFGIDLLISRTGYTGELGYELYVPADQVARIWQTLLEHPMIRPAGLGARDTLRLEMGYPLYGSDLDQTTTPLEAGFGRLIKMEDRDFVGRDALLTPPRRQLAGLLLEGRRAARHGARVWTRQGQCIGTVTSGAFAPSLSQAVAIGYLDAEANPKPGLEVLVGAAPDQKALSASITPLPFYRTSSLRD